MSNKIHADIVVVGGGVSGFAAAIAASFEDKKVVLIDKNAAIGGDSVNTNVGTICGAYIRSALSPKLVGYKFSENFLHALQHKCEFAKPVHNPDGLYTIPYEWSALRQLYDEMLRDHHIEVKRETQLTALEVNGTRITTVIVNQQNQIFEITTEAVVDCSGNAIVSQLAGLETIHEDAYQAASQIFRVTNVASDNEYSLNMALKRGVLKRMTDQQWPLSYVSLSVVPGSLREGKVDLKFTLPEIITDDAAHIEAIARQSQQRVSDLYNVIREEVESLKHSKVEMIFPKPGVRVLQRSKGKYILTEEDVLGGKKFDDSIATGTWPIEEWDNNGKLNMKYIGLNKTYSIPAGCLISDSLENLFFAGKNISATPKAIASARVMGTGLQTGYAAGKIACGKTAEERDNIIASLYNELDKF